jgi:hypothetical protein
MPDGNPRSIKISEISDSIVKAIFIPRNKLSGINDLEDLKNPGIYFLLGNEDEIGKPNVYIGEADPLLNRLKQHNADKEFWNTAICFVSEKNNLDKAHVKYLENLACIEAQRINKCVLENSNTPTQSALRAQEIDFVLSFYDDLKVLLSSLGFPIFMETIKKSKDLFVCQGKDAYAEGEYTEEGMIVFKGSKSQVDETESAGEWIKNLRRRLIEDTVLIKDSGVYIFTEDYIFSSPSAAAATVLGRAVNGWTAWKTKDGVTLDNRYRE